MGRCPRKKVADGPSTTLRRHARGPARAGHTVRNCPNLGMVLPRTPAPTRWKLITDAALAARCGGALSGALRRHAAYAGKTTGYPEGTLRFFSAKRVTLWP